MERQKYKYVLSKAIFNYMTWITYFTQGFIWGCTFLFIFYLNAAKPKKKCLPLSKDVLALGTSVPCFKQISRYYHQGLIPWSIWDSLLLLRRYTSFTCKISSFCWDIASGPIFSRLICILWTFSVYQNQSSNLFWLLRNLDVIKTIIEMHPESFFESIKDSQPY